MKIILLNTFHLQRGRLNYMQKNIDEAKACFDSALAVAPKHIESMEKIVSTYSYVRLMPFHPLFPCVL